MSIIFIVIGAVSLAAISFRFISRAASRQASERYSLDEKVN
ncbi:MAG TPA: hypothetical protein VIS94_11520 [Desulfomonilia bacterium]|jgi:hypothetical protein